MNFGEFGFGPLRADVEREIILWRGEPVVLLVRAGRSVLNVDGQRAVGRELHRFTLGSE